MKLKKIIDHKDITTQKCDKLTAEKFAASLGTSQFSKQHCCFSKNDRF